MAFFLDVQIGDTIKIGDITVELKHKSGKGVVRLGINANKDLPVIRYERGVRPLKNRSNNFKVDS